MKIATMGGVVNCFQHIAIFMEIDFEERVSSLQFDRFLFF